MKKLTINKNVTDRTVEEGVTEFIRHGKVKCLLEQTLQYHTDMLKVFTGYVGGDTLLSCVDGVIVEDYTLNLTERSDSRVSVNTWLRGLRSFLYWAMRQGYCKSFKIALTKEGETIKPTYSAEELRLLLRKPDLMECSFAEYRNWAIVNFLLATGLRAESLSNVRVADVDLAESMLHVRHSKNKRQQIIPISKGLNRVLAEYLEYRNHQSQDDYLFPNQYNQKLRARAAELGIRKYGKWRGVDKCGLHRFRRTFASHWIMADGDPFRLQKILGHSSIDIVRRYVSIYGHDLQRDFGKLNPLDSLLQDKAVIRMDRMGEWYYVEENDEYPLAFCCIIV